MKLLCWILCNGHHFVDMPCRDDPTAFLLLSWRLCLDWILKHVSMGGGQCCCIRKCHSRSHRRSGRTVDKGIRFLTIHTWEKQDPILCISGARPCYGSWHGSNPLPRTQSQNWMFLNPIAIKFLPVLFFFFLSSPSGLTDLNNFWAKQKRYAGNHHCRLRYQSTFLTRWRPVPTRRDAPSHSPFIYFST